MKFYKIILLVFFIACPINANDGIVDKISDGVLSITSKSLESILDNIGRGDTEVIIGGSQKNKPSGSIMIVRPIMEFNKSVIFNQTQVNNNFVRGKNRFTLNLGLGYRDISEDETFFTGYNIFVDVDSEKNKRASLGLEFKSTPFEMSGNYYKRISGVTKVGDFNERVLDGYDIDMVGQVPYLSWLDITYSNYKWKKVKNIKNSKGNKLGLEIYFMKNIDLALGVDHNNIDGDILYGNLIFKHRDKPRKSMMESFEEGKLISDVAFQESNVRNKLLSKVRRTNRIVVESEGSGVVISRAIE